MCISQSPHSICVRLHLPEPAAFGSSPCSHLFIPTAALLSASAQARQAPDALPYGSKAPSRAQPCVSLTLAALLWLLGHCLAAGIVSHATAPVPSGPPGPPSPEAPGSRAKPKATSVSFQQTWSLWSFRPSQLPAPAARRGSPPRSLQPV